jgi:hypothetical protein
MANILLEKIASQACSRLALQGDGPGLRARRLRVRTVRFLKVDTEAERELAAQYNIKSIPTLMLFRTGAVIAQQAGAMDAQALRAWLTRPRLISMLNPFA